MEAGCRAGPDRRASTFRTLNVSAKDRLVSPRGDRTRFSDERENSDGSLETRTERRASPIADRDGVSRKVLWLEVIWCAVGAEVVRDDHREIHRILQAICQMTQVIRGGRHEETPLDTSGLIPLGRRRVVPR